MLASLLLYGCASEKEQEAAALAANLINAGYCTVGYTSSASTENGSYKAIKISFSDFGEVSAYFSDQDLASLGALVFIEQLEPSDYEGFTKITSIINRNESVYEKLYTVDELLLALELIESAKTVYNGLAEQSLDLTREVVNTEALPDSSLQSMFIATREIENKHGEMNTLSLAGFEYGEIESLGIEALAIKAYSISGEAMTNFNFVVDTKSKKVFYIRLNQ